MSERHPKLLVEDIIESANKILTYTDGLNYIQFESDNKTTDAVVRNFEIIGEAANRLPETFKRAHSDVDWKRIKGLRNRIVHDYFGIDLLIVWQIKEHYLKELITMLEKKLPLL